MFSRKTIGFWDNVDRLFEELNTGGLELSPYLYAVGSSLKNTGSLDSASLEITDTSVIYTVDLPGITKEELSIDIEKEKVLSVRAQNERRVYSQAYTIDKRADVNSVSSKLENGVLTITFGLKPQQEPKQSSIKVNIA